jgi:chromosome segregation protein
MAHVKKLVLHGFKSFAKKTEIPFSEGINTIVGPNGSGKSNISDALCFVLGRLSIKSIRAAKAKNLIFMGSKYVKPGREASVEIVFDNSDKVFTLNSSDVSVKRIVRANGVGIYKINGETKTRGEVIETLAQAGIDPYGYNIIMQGQIQGIVKMHPEERRKIIEEVAGISIYESRKEKSLKELDKTESRLKEVGTILRERGAFLANLEKEKAQAQKYNDMKETAKKARASILKRRLEDKKKEVDAIDKAIEKDNGERNKKIEECEKLQTKIDEMNSRIQDINKEVREGSGVEQSKLRSKITDLRADLEGLRVRKEGYENRREEIERRIAELDKQAPEMENEIKSLREEKPGLAKKADEIIKKKMELGELEKERKKIMTLKTELQGLNDRIFDREKQLSHVSGESESIMKQIEELSRGLEFLNEEDCAGELKNLVKELEEKRIDLEDLNKREMSNEKIVSVSEVEIKRVGEIDGKVSDIDVCPLCQNKMTEEHREHVYNDSENRRKRAQREMEASRKELEKISLEKDNVKSRLLEVEKRGNKLEKEFNILGVIEEKKRLIKKEVIYEKDLRGEIGELNNKKSNLENKDINIGVVEGKIQDIILEIEEISSRTDENVDSTLMYKERELEKVRGVVERARIDLEDIEQQVYDISEGIDLKTEELTGLEEKENEINDRFEKMLSERDSLQNNINDETVKLHGTQNESRQIEDQMNYLKTGKAKLEGEREILEVDFSDFSGVEILQGSLKALEEKLVKTNSALEQIGSINMRALEVYDEVKGEYDVVKGKVDTLDAEKIEIIKIIEEIDKKKKTSFMRTYRAINSLFSSNFEKLTTKKASASLDIANKEEIFSGGVDISVKMGKGKYFDVSSLSGGEQTLVALSLLFAIQEHKPYQFYILDEIDAALDKRNSERLADLLNQYMKSGQYIVVTHNDAVIMNSQLLYGVSMHDGVSKILSLNLNLEKST